MQELNQQKLAGLSSSHNCQKEFMDCVKASVMLIGAGAAVLKFFSSQEFHVFGWSLVVLGVWLLLNGYNRMAQLQKVAAVMTIRVI